MRKYSTNLAFVDLLFNLLVGFTSLLLIAFLLINPVAQKAKIDPKTKVLVTIEWPAESAADIDLWMRGPDNRAISFRRKEIGYMVLERDDLGITNDKYIIDGKEVIVNRNLETISLNDLPKGEYVINVHNYSTGPTGSIVEKEYPIPVTVTVQKIDPFKLIYTAKVVLDYRQEKTVVTFMVKEKEVIDDLRTDVQVWLYYDREENNKP